MNIALKSLDLRHLFGVIGLFHQISMNIPTLPLVTNSDKDAPSAINDTKSLLGERRETETFNFMCLVFQQLASHLSQSNLQKI